MFDGLREARFVPKPIEPNSIFERWTNSFQREGETGDDEVQAVKSVVGKITAYHGKKRFLAKLVGRPVKISLLSRAFPYATFVHVTRELKPTVSSLLKVDFYNPRGGMEHWHWDKIPDTYFQQYQRLNEAPEVAAAIKFLLNRKELNLQLRQLPADRWTRLQYSSFVSDPAGSLREICRVAGLAVDDTIARRWERRRVRVGSDIKWQTALSLDQIKRLDSLTRPPDTS
jgi:hypothetical protein